MTGTRDETFTVGDRATVDVRSATGSLTVVAGQPNRVDVRISGRDPSAFVVEQSGDRIRVRPDDRGPGRWSSAEILLRVPPGVGLEVRGAALEVTAETPLDRLQANLASGSLRVDAVDGEAVVRTAAGDVDVDEIGGRLEATTASGDVRVGRLIGGGSIGSASGDVCLRAAAEALTIRTASGDIEVDGYAGADLSCASMSGDVRVSLPPGRTVDIDLVTLSGHVTQDFPPVSDGRGQVRVAVKTVSGDIRLRSAEDRRARSGRHR